MYRPVPAWCPGAVCGRDSGVYAKSVLRVWPVRDRARMRRFGWSVARCDWGLGL